MIFSVTFCFSLYPSLPASLYIYLSLSLSLLLSCCRPLRSLRDLLHRDYADFINLSTKLDGVDEQLARAVAPTKVARASCAVVQAQVRGLCIFAGLSGDQYGSMEINVLILSCTHTRLIMRSLPLSLSLSLSCSRAHRLRPSRHVRPRCSNSCTSTRAPDGTLHNNHSLAFTQPVYTKKFWDWQIKPTTPNIGQ